MINIYLSQDSKVLNALLVAAGGGLGALCRFYLTLTLQKIVSPQYLHFSTALINLLGCYLIGFLIGILSLPDSVQQKSLLQYFLIFGFLASFTTFSTFAVDGYRLVLSNNWLGLLTYMMVSVILGVFFVYLGVLSSRIG